jgi:hypothetical protein
MPETVLMEDIPAHHAKDAQMDIVLIKTEGHALDQDQSAVVHKNIQPMVTHAKHAKETGFKTLEITDNVFQFLVVVTTS